jgi:hypothetical protein
MHVRVASRYIRICMRHDAKNTIVWTLHAKDRATARKSWSLILQHAATMSNNAAQHTACGKPLHG